MVAQEHTPGLAVVTVLVRRAGRVVSVAMRLDGAKGQWELVELPVVIIVWGWRGAANVLRASPRAQLARSST